MKLDDEILIAYVDGELRGDDARRFEEAMAGDAAMCAQVEKQRRLRASLRASFDPVLSAEVPVRLISSALTAPASWQWRVREALRWNRYAERIAPTRLRLRVAVGLAAAVIAVIVVVRAPMPGEEGLIAERGGRLIAQGSLASALTTRLAADTGVGPRIGISFRSTNGAQCRTFFAAGNAGVACRSNDGWRIAMLAAARPQGPADFHAAGAEMPQAIRDAVARMISGDPFDAAQERAARRKGWK